jgi:hypothetical protein
VWFSKATTEQHAAESTATQAHTDAKVSLGDLLAAPPADLMPADHAAAAVTATTGTAAPTEAHASIGLVNLNRLVDDEHKNNPLI